MEMYMRAQESLGVHESTGVYIESGNVQECKGEYGKVRNSTGEYGGIQERS